MAQDLQRMRQGKEELQTGKKQQKGKGQREKKRALAGLFLAFGRSASSLCSPFISEFCHVVQPTYI